MRELVILDKQSAILILFTIDTPYDSQQWMT